MFHDYTSASIPSRELTPAQKHRAEYMNEIRTDETSEKEVKQPNRDSATLLRNVFANASRFARLS